uniref:Accessory protein 9b n=1 Tax=Bat SARS-like coronavirus TaxID=1508227 RepID=A0A2R3SUW6_SARS|nr:hypothetical protein [Bat SARS-like coronavirus]
MDPKTNVVHPALHLVDPQIQVTIAKTESAMVHDLNNVDPKAYPIILHLGSPLSLNMARKTLRSLEGKVFQSTPIALKMTKLATTVELPDEFVVVTVK